MNTNYLVHNEKEIRGFFEDYRWLSNFWGTPVVYEGIEYPTAENAYQATKVIKECRAMFSSCTPGKEKKYGKNLN